MGFEHVCFAHTRVRQNIRQLSEDWRELDNIYRVEAKKKRSKFSKDELNNQQHIVIQMNEEINKIKELQRSGYVKMNNDADSSGGGGKAIVTMDQSSLFTTNLGDTGTTVGNNGVEMTSTQQAQVQVRRARGGGAEGAERRKQVKSGSAHSQTARRYRVLAAENALFVSLELY